MRSQELSSNRLRLAVLPSVVVLLATSLLLLALSTVQASKAPTIALSPADYETASLNNGSVITVGVAAALNSPLLGWPQANSVQLAISQTNAAGGINVGGVTYTLALVVADGGCNATQAVTAANTLLNAGVVAVVGHSCSIESLSAQSVYNAAGVAMVSSSSTNPQVTQQGYSTTFRTVSHDGAVSTLLATYFRSWLSLSKSAVVDGPDRIWGNQIGDIYSNTFAALGGTITSRREVAGTGDFPAVLNAIKTENPDVIFYVDPDPTRGGQFSLSAYGLGMTNTVMGWSSWDQIDDSALTTYASAAGAAAAENDHAALNHRRFQDMPGWATFLADYQAVGFANEPTNPGPYGAFAYDTARIIIAAIDRADSTNPTAIRNEIAATKNYAGVIGTYQGFDANGDVIPQWAWLERYQGGQWMILNPSKIFLPVVLKSFGQ